jgi:2'-5' RNA ligase
MQEEIKRLFFGLEVLAPWPHEFPKGRLLADSCRHLTLAFLGQTSYTQLQTLLPTLPAFPLQVGLVGTFDQCLFLPEKQPHVVAWHVKWLEDVQPLEAFRHDLVAWLKKADIPVDEKNSFLPHVTICRSPQEKDKWQAAFKPLPLIVKDLHLYESLGNCTYKPIWSSQTQLPFEEIEHTADIAFRIWGKDITQMQLHAYAALAFKFPPLLDYFSYVQKANDLDDIVIGLNEIVAKADEELGCPYKAISFHGQLKEVDQILTWEMIVDV